MIQDPELNEVLASFKEAIDLIVLKIENLEKRSVITEDAVKNIETKFITEIYEPAQKAFDEAIDAENFKQFSDKYSERLTPFSEGLKAIEGDDFDVVRRAYDEFNALEDKNISSDDYINVLISSIENQLNAIRDKLGASSVKAEVTPEGVEVQVDGMDAPDKGEDKELTNEDVVEFAEDVLDSPEEIAKFERELAASLKK